MDKVKISFKESSNVDIKIGTSKIEVSANDDFPAKINLIPPQLNLSVKDTFTLVIPGTHKDLQGLDYENSGHTGFASQKELSILKENVLSKDLSILPSLNINADRSKVNIYVDNNGMPSKISAKNLLSTLIRTTTSIPVDLQDGEYIFLEKGNDNNGNN